jgi:hypothetical protein
VRQPKERWHPARDAWLSQTEACERPITERNHSGLQWRRFGKVAVAVDFDTHAYTLHRIETFSPKSGDVRRALNALKALADNFGGAVVGFSHAYSTAECPAPDPERLNAFYRSCGFSLGSEGIVSANFMRR